jgi:hypothetical protein
MIKIRSKILAACAMAAVLMGGAGAAWAGTSWATFNTTVGKFNGSGYTGNQTKTTGGAYVQLKNLAVGGSYVVDARAQQQNGSNSGAWANNLGDGATANLSNSINAGVSTRVQFSNELLTPVDVQVQGSWRSQ